LTVTSRFLERAKAPWTSKRRRIGIAIGADVLYVANLSNEGHRRRSFPAWWARLPHSVLDPAVNPYDVIRAALADCPQLSRENPAAVHVVLLPPLALGRRVSLPRLTEAEYRQVLARDSFKYFATDRSPRVVGVLPLSEKRSSPVPVFAASAPARLVDAVEKVITDMGCELASLDCAYASWAGAATSMWPSLGRLKSAIIVCQDDVTEIIYFDGKRPEIVRRLSARAPIGQMLDAIGMYSRGGPPRACAILGSVDRYNEWGSALTEAGVAVLPSNPTSTMSGGALSAMYAAAGNGPGLYPERMFAESRAAAQRLARRLGVVAAALLIASAGLLLWGTKRELSATLAERAAIRAEVSSALGVRSDIGALEARSRMIATLRSTTPHWSAVLSSIARELPDDAQLTSLRAQADTVVLEGDAARAAGVFEALQRNQDITAVHSNAPVRQQLQDGTPVEHFSVAARLAPPTRPVARE
jgi:Tfp pilus assembly protein PilN